MEIRPIKLFSKYRDLMPYVLAQAKFESGNFKSKVYLTDHNYFGMKWTNGKRGQVAERGFKSPEGDYYARYATDSASVLDLLKWFEYKKFPNRVASLEEYVGELVYRDYFTGDKVVYLNGLKKYMS